MNISANPDYDSDTVISTYIITMYKIQCAMKKLLQFSFKHAEFDTFLNVYALHSAHMGTKVTSPPPPL